MNEGGCLTESDFQDPMAGWGAENIGQYTEGVDWDIVTLRLVRPTPERVQKWKDGTYDMNKDE